MCVIAPPRQGPDHVRAMKRILFVEDDPKELETLRRKVSPFKDEWAMEFVSSGREALTALSREPFDVVLSDMDMPGMDGAQLLAEIRSRYPQVVRIIVSAQSDQQSLSRSLDSAHQFVPKPVNPAVLKATVSRAYMLRDLLGNEALRKLVNSMPAIPSLPTLYREIMAELQSPNASLKRIGQIVNKDMGMVTKILQWVNSPFYGLRTRISSAEQAVNLLGIDTVKSLVLSMKVFSQFEDFRLSFFSLDVLQRHGLMTAKYARAIAKEEHASQAVMEDAFTAGLLHDVGILVLAANLPDKYAEVLAIMRDQSLPEWEAEHEVVGATHAEIGAYLLGIWGLSDNIVEAVAFHHTPRPCTRDTFSPLAAVHVANAFDEEETSLDPKGIPAAQVDDPYLTDCGLAHRFPLWRNACQRAQRIGPE